MKRTVRNRSRQQRRPQTRSARPDLWYGWLAGGLLLLVVVAYLPIMQAGFIWDDDQHVLYNRELRTIAGLGRIWADPTATPQYYPLVHTMFWTEYHLWGAQPLGYHLVNLVLHALCALLLWRVLRRLEVPFAYLAAMIFALHPVSVESAAWITERKNVLSGCFYLASAWAFLGFRWPRPGRSLRQTRWLYALSLLLFMGALLSKTVTCSLPAALLLVVWWKDGRLRARDLLAVLPMFALGLAAAALTVFLEKYHVGALGNEWNLTLIERLLIAGRVVAFYAAKLVWPANLAFIYPRWVIDASSWWQYLFPLAVIGVGIGLLLGTRRWGRGPLAAYCFFVGTLVPALGLFDVYPMRYSFVADHFQYLASIGAILGLLATARLWLPQRWLKPASVVVVGVLLVMTFNRTAVFQNTRILWEDTLRKNPTCWLAYHSLGNLALERGESPLARQLFDKSLSLHEDDVEAHANLGLLLTGMANYTEAEQHLRRAIELDPKWIPAHVNYGMLLMRTNRASEAEAEFKSALAIDPAIAGWHDQRERFPEHGDIDWGARGDHGIAHFNLGTLYLQRNELPEAERELRAALRDRPGLSDAHNNLGNVLRLLGNLDAAIVEFQSALSADPGNASARQNLQSAMKLRGKR